MKMFSHTSNVGSCLKWMSRDEGRTTIYMRFHTVGGLQERILKEGRQWRQTLDNTQGFFFSNNKATKGIYSISVHCTAFQQKILSSCESSPKNNLPLFMINITTWESRISRKPYCYSGARVVHPPPLTLTVFSRCRPCALLMPRRVADTDLSPRRTCWLVAVKEVERTELWQLNIWGIHPAFTSNESIFAPSLEGQLPRPVLAQISFALGATWRLKAALAGRPSNPRRRWWAHRARWRLIKSAWNKKTDDTSLYLPIFLFFFF